MHRNVAAAHGDGLDEELDLLVVQIMPQARAEAWRVFQRAPHALELDELHSIALKGLAEARARWRTYCVSPDMNVLTADLRWVPAGTLAVGDELVGVDEENPSRAGRCYRRSIVLAAKRRTTACIRLTMEDGRQVTTSTDHRWLIHRRTGQYRARRLGLHQDHYRWEYAATLQPGDRIAAPLRVWPTETSYEAGWLAGIFDGEGWLAKKGNAGQQTTTGIAQNSGPVWERAMKLLAEMDIPYGVSSRGPDDCNRLTIGARWAVIEVVGRLRPVRFLLASDRIWENWRIVKTRSVLPNALAVTAVEFIGPQEVVSLETSTRTFLCEGLVAHNCAEKGHDPWAIQYFGAYCTRRIRGAMLDAMRSQDWVTRSARTKAKRLRDYGQDLGIPEEELAARSGLTVAEIRETMAAVAAKPVSIDAEPHDVADEADVEGQAVVSSVLGAATTVLSGMGETSELVLALRYYWNLPLPDIAAVLGVEEDQAARLHTDAVLAVYDAMLRAVTA
jgi:DNA-directed RNA polymerase specialized sigma subunit